MNDINVVPLAGRKVSITIKGLWKVGQAGMPSIFHGFLTVMSHRQQRRMTHKKKPPDRLVPGTAAGSLEKHL